MSAPVSGRSPHSDKPRDWERERTLFWPGARLIPTATVPGRNDVELAPLILDVDTGVDDALALLYACASPEVRLIGVTCVMGNVTVDQATVETTVTTMQAGKETVNVVQFKLVKANGVWLIDGKWILSEAMKRGLGGMFMNGSE